MCEFFSCKLDALMRGNLGTNEKVYSDMRIQMLEAFQMARYVMIAPNPKADVYVYLKSWAEKSGLLEIVRDVQREFIEKSVILGIVSTRGATFDIL